MSASVSVRLIESLTTGRVIGAVIIFLVTSFIIDFTWKPHYPKTLPRVGYGDGALATVRNWLGYIVHYNSWVEEGYKKYSKQEKFFVVPSAASRPSEIVVPKSQTMWLLDFPDRTVSAIHAHDEVLHSHYNFLGYRDTSFSIGVVHKHLARHLPRLIPGVQEEVHNAIDETLGLDTENWKTVNLWDIWIKIVSQVTNRVVVGKDVCRNQGFLQCQVAFADDVVRNGFLLSMVPKVLHPIFGRLLAMPNWWHWRKATDNLRPVLEKRLEKMGKKMGGDPAYEDWEPEEDLVTWLIRQAYIDGKAHELSVDNVSKWILPVEFAAIHTTVLTGHSLLLDLLASDPKRGYLDTIREETSRVFGEENGSWTKQGLASLYRTDSAIRESQRYSIIATSLVHRKVIAEEGITHPQEKWHVPNGSLLMLNLSYLHHDPELYEEPGNYDAWRFSRIREEYDSRPPEQKDSEEGLRVKKLGMVTTSDKHMAFGHGRHACPGRFFVAHELKMILAYLLTNYEVKQIPERPQPQWIGQTIIPPLAATMELKRRKGTA
ncbi:cytochrome P450 [Thozetella sp. PMI_491]|nr:cytochrome P450 [Thozetella sp. PMI_491]